MEDSIQASGQAPRKPSASHVTIEVYDFDKERHEVWDVPCIQPSGSESFIIVAVKVRCSLVIPDSVGQWVDTV